MNLLHLIKSVLIIIITALLILGCSNDDNVQNKLKDSLTFYASFDYGLTADYSKGDPFLYISESWSSRDDHEMIHHQSEHMVIHENEGVYGGALWMDSGFNPVYFYQGDQNISFSQQNWSGTVSFWLRLDPNTTLREGYSDPIQITAQAWNDGALFVDFTDQIPRIFRYAIFPDREVWDPERLNWDDVPVEDRPMIDIEEPPFNEDDWVHVAFTFKNFNTGNNDGLVDGYLNGVYAGSLKNREMTFSWDEAPYYIWLGYNYRGYFDELAIFDQYFDEEIISALYDLENGVRQLLDD